MVETLQQKIQRVVAEQIDVVAYDSHWPKMFLAERDHLLSCLPSDLIKRIEHFGSTAVPGLAAKPVVDMLVEVTSLQRTQHEVVPILEQQGYDYFWRPNFGENIPPFYAWFIKRNVQGQRTFHIHMVERDFPHWERLLFRDYLRNHPDAAGEYQQLKLYLAQQHGQDRIAYTEAKTAFIVATTQKAFAELDRDTDY